MFNSSANQFKPWGSMTVRKGWQNGIVREIRNLFLLSSTILSQLAPLFCLPRKGG